MEVTIRKLSDKGHEDIVVPSAQQGMDMLQKEVENGNWVYLNGEYTQMDTINAEILEKASEILVTNSIQGG